MSEQFAGEIRLFGGNYAPKGWAICNGQLLNISQYNMLYAILGTQYGGDGKTTFALPDLRGRVPVGFGQAPGLQDIRVGEQGGAAAHVLTTNEMPAHTHPATAKVNVSNNAGNSDYPGNGYPARSASGDKIYTNSANTTMQSDMVQVAVGLAGSSLPHNNMQPFLGMNFIIALVGDFPQRD